MANCKQFATCYKQEFKIILLICNPTDSYGLSSINWPDLFHAGAYQLGAMSSNYKSLMEKHSCKESMATQNHVVAILYGHYEYLSLYHYLFNMLMWHKYWTRTLRTVNDQS